jgi:hypothetical protein
MINVNTDWLLYTAMTKTDTWQTRPLVREVAPKKQDSNYEKKICGQKPQIGLDTKTYWLTDRRS